jgi:hypothetical protein
MSWYWKEVDTKDNAEDATKLAVGASYFVSVVSGVLAVISIATRQPVFGVDGWALVDAALFAVIGWRISRLSRAWTVVGLCLYVMEVVGSFSSRSAGFGVLSLIFVLGYINAVRGVFAYHRFVKQEKAEVPVPPAETENAQI